jgi:hypothetical protein
LNKVREGLFGIFEQVLEDRTAALACRDGRLQAEDVGISWQIYKKILCPSLNGDNYGRCTITVACPCLFWRRRRSAWSAPIHLAASCWQFYR